MRKWEVRLFYGTSYDTDWVEVLRFTNVDADGFDPNNGIPVESDEYIDPGSDAYYEALEDIIEQYVFFDVSELEEAPADVLKEFIKTALETYPWDTEQPAIGYKEE